MTVLPATGSFLRGDIIYLEEFPISNSSTVHVVENGASASGWDVSHAQDDAVFDGRLYGGFNAANTTTGSVASLRDSSSDDGSTGLAFNDIVISDFDSIDFSFTYTNGRFGNAEVAAIRSPDNSTGLPLSTPDTAQKDRSPRFIGRPVLLRADGSDTLRRSPQGHSQVAAAEKGLPQTPLGELSWSLTQ